MRGWKGSRETRLLTICHSCHGCLLLSFLSCRDANSGLGGQSSISEENGLFIHCHRVARYALHWNLACDLHCATKLLKISCFHPLQVTVCWGHHMYALWTPRWQFDNTQFTRQGHAEVMVSNLFTPYYNFPFLSFLHFFPVILLLSLTCCTLPYHSYFPFPLLSPQYAQHLGRYSLMYPMYLAYTASKLCALFDSCETPTGSVWGHTELFWHCTLVLLKRSAVTRWLTPCTCTTHS